MYDYEGMLFVCLWLQLRLWVLTLGFTLSFGALFAKTWQVYRVYTNSELKKKVQKNTCEECYFLWRLSNVTRLVTLRGEGSFVIFAKQLKISNLVLLSFQDFVQLLVQLDYCLKYIAVVLSYMEHNETIKCWLNMVIFTT